MPSSIAGAAVYEMQEIRSKSLILAAILAAGIAMLAVTPPAGASSAVDQYREFVPEADGDRSPPGGDRPGGDPAEPNDGSADAADSTTDQGAAGPGAGVGGDGPSAFGSGSDGTGADGENKAGDDRATARNRQPALAAIARDGEVSPGDLGITWIAIVAAVSLAGIAGAMTISRRRGRTQ